MMTLICRTNTMIFGITNKVARNIHIVCKRAPIVAPRISGSRPFKECKSEKELFQSALPKVISAITASPQFTEIPEFADTVKQILDYTLVGGKCTRGLSTVLTYKFMEKPEKITEESLELSRILGWCVEMTSWLMLDDIMDKSETRRGRTCWYLLPDVGVRAVNDSSIINGVMLKFLKTNFEHMPQYSKIMEQFNDVVIHTAAGQHLDYIMKHQKDKDYALFTCDIYDVMVKYKTSYYSYVLPVYLGMILANVHDMEILKKVKEICYKLGRLYQVQNDFTDAFALESETGKLGTDIQEGKCTWFAVTALQNCNETQRKTFTTYYGSEDPAHIEEIKRLYEQLKLPEIYKEEKRIQYDEIMLLAYDIKAISRAPDLFLELLRLFPENK